MNRTGAALAIGLAALSGASSLTAQQVWRPVDPADASLLREIAHKHVHKSGHTCSAHDFIRTAAMRWTTQRPLGHG
jgi:hypothetical protein